MLNNVNDKLFTDQAKKRLENDKELSSRVDKVIQNILNIKDDIFEIKRIDVSNDPDDPEWRPIEIHLNIKIEDFHKRLDKKHEIVKKAFENILDRRDIFILGAI